MKKSFNVFGVKVPVRTFKETEETKTIYGYCQKDPLAIFINDSISKEMFHESLLHELGHAIIFRAGLDQVLSEEIQEIICEQFAKFINENYRLKK